MQKLSKIHLKKNLLARLLKNKLKYLHFVLLVISIKKLLLCYSGKLFGSQSTLDNDSDNESSIMSELNTPPLLLFDNEAEVEDVVDEEVEDEFVQYSKNNSRENLYTPDDSENYKNNLSVMLT